MFSDCGVSDGVVDARVEQLLLKLFDGEADASPVLVVLAQVGLAAVDKDKVFGLPVASVLVSVDLTVHPQLTVGQSPLAPSALVRLGPEDDPVQRLSVVLDPLVKVQVHVQVAEPELSAHDLSVSLLKPAINTEVIITL